MADQKPPRQGAANLGKGQGSNVSVRLIPRISVNELSVELEGLEPRDDIKVTKSDDGGGVLLSSPTSRMSPSSSRNSVQSVSTPKRGDGSSSEEERLKSFHGKLLKDHGEEDSSLNQQLRRWRRKLLILIWLNFTMRYRKWFNTFIEVLTPIFILAILLAGFINNGKIDTAALGNSDAVVHDGEAFSPFNIMPRDMLLNSFCANEQVCDQTMKPEDRTFLIVYAPNTTFIKELVEDALQILNIKLTVPDSKLIAVNTPKEVEEQCKNLLLQNNTKARYPAGIVFSFNELEDDPQEFPANTKIPPKLNYVIRTFFPEIANTAEKFPLVERAKVGYTRQDVSPYIITGVAGLQTALDEAFMGLIVEDLRSKGRQYVSNSSISIKSVLKEFKTRVHLQQFRYPFFLDEKTRKISWTILVTIFIMAYIPSNFCCVQEFCYQAQQGRTELLKFHGLTPMLHFLSHGIITCVFRALTSIGLTTVMYYAFMKNSQLPYPSTFEVWLFMFAHAMAEHTSNLLISHFFTNPSVGGMMVVFRSLVTFLLPLQSLIQDNISLKRIYNIIMALVFTEWNFANGLYTFLEYQLYNEGLQWFDFAVIIDEEYVIIPLQCCCMIFVYTATFYMLLSVYLDITLNKTFSPGKGFLFCCKKNKKPEHAKPPTPVQYEFRKGLFEKPSPDTRTIIAIRKLCKVLDDNAKELTIAVDNFNLDIHEGEITAIVGRAGSGKSRLLSMICGLEVPTSGSVEIKNLNVTEYGDVLSDYISLVPQHDMLFDTLSVEDHVKMSCMLHGISYRKAIIQTQSLMQLLDLTPFKRHLHTYLSVTQQKLLSIAMALASHPNILILDEPNQGLDVEADKQLWRTLQLLKAGRTIIIATSSMEGVALYCDRMALMAQGKLVAYASPSSIKRALNVGLTLNLREKDQHVDTHELDKIIKSELIDAVRLRPVGYEPLRNTHRYLLPYDTPVTALLEKIEDNMAQLQYSKLWVGRVELDALFYKMSILKIPESVIAAKETTITKGISRDSIQLYIDTTAEIKKVELKPTQWTNYKTLLYRKLIHTMQKNRFVITDFLVPIALYTIVFGFSEMFLNVEPETSARPIRIQMYQNTHTFIRPLSNTEADQNLWFDVIKKTVKSQTEKIPIHTSMKNMFEKKATHSQTNFKKQSIVAFEKSSDQFIGYYSMHAPHSAPIALNVIANSYLRMLAGDQYEIHMTNYPLRDSSGRNLGSVYNNATITFGCLISLIVGLMAASELNLPMTEMKNPIKKLISMSKVIPSIYWVANWTGDFLVNAVIVGCLVGITRALAFVGAPELENSALGYYALILALYLCWASIPFSYIFSHIFETKTNGYTHFIVLHFGLGILLTVGVNQMKIFVPQTTHEKVEWLECQEVNYASYALQCLGHIFPAYSFTSALVHFFHTATARNFCNQKSLDIAHKCESYENLVKDIVKRKDFKNIETQNMLSLIDEDVYFRSCCRAYCAKRGICHQKDPFFIASKCLPGLFVDVMALVIQGGLYWLLLVAIERRLIQDVAVWLYTNIFGNKERKAAQDDVRELDEAEDVKNERIKVNAMVDTDEDVDSEVFLVQNLTKFFKLEKRIDHAYFSTPVNESTAIFGLAKSGLTTMVKMLTTEMSPSAGYIFMDNELLHHADKVHCTAKIGYCPQTDGYFPQLTAGQNLFVMGRLRGVRTEDIDAHVHHYIELFGLVDYISVAVKTFRPGIRRKLACAMAMIGQPPVIILDQPTLRMDSPEQHAFWKAIQVAKRLGETVIYTSSNTEEVLANANKAILIDCGSVISVGNPQDVIQTNSRGYILTIRLNSEILKSLDIYEIRLLIDQLRDHILRYLNPCELILDDDRVLIYALLDTSAKLSFNYGIIEGAQEKFPGLIDHFLITEPSLDEIVLKVHKSNQQQRRTSIRLSAALADDHSFFK